MCFCSVCSAKGTVTLNSRIRTGEECCKCTGQRSQRCTLFQLMFPQISFERLNAGICDGPQILQLMRNSMLDDILSAPELSV